ncbi:MAG: T9SS type A sorting domain-containing protein [Deltaproteobacteria bacterium]
MKNWYKTIVTSLIFVFSLNLNLKAECGLNDPIISNIQCIENAVYEFDVNFSISDPTLDSFDIFINENFYGRFSIFQLPVKVIQNQFSNKKFDKMKISDPDRENCYVIKEIENPCSCAIFNPKYAIRKCNDTTFYISLFFNNFETSDSFDVGMIGKFFGTYAYKNLPVTIGPFKKKDTIYTLNIVDKKDIFCFSELKVKSGKCENCAIKEIQLTGHECTSNGQVYLKLAFNHTSVKSNKYGVVTNFSDNKFFEYKFKKIVDSVTFREEFVLGPISINCEKPLSVSIWDFENQLCGSSAVFDTICCDEKCEIGDIYVKELECTSDSTYSFYLKFTYQNNSSKVFSVNIDNQYNGIFNVDQLPLKISGIKLDGSKKDFIKVCMDEGECCKAIEYTVPECEKENCVIENVTWQPIFDTTAGKFWIKLDFKYSNSSESFYVKGNGKNYGTFSYSSLPIILGSYNCKDQMPLEYIIQDSKYIYCKKVIEPGVIKCPTSSLNVETGDENWNIYHPINTDHLVLYSASSVSRAATIELFNLVGKKILSSKIENGHHEITIKLPENSEGILFVRFKNSDDIYTSKIFVQRG